MNDLYANYEVKKADFKNFAHLIKWETAIGKGLVHAKYDYEIKARADDPTKYFGNEWIEVRTHEYEYKINVSKNSQLENEKQLLNAILCPDRIIGLLEREEI